MFKVREDKISKPQYKQLNHNSKTSSQTERKPVALELTLSHGEQHRKQDSLGIADHPKYRVTQTHGISQGGLKPLSTGQTQRLILTE